MGMLKKQLGKTRGATFVEVLVSLFIVTFGIMSSLLYMTTAKAATELAKEKTIAITHAEIILEEMKTKSTLVNITTTNWQTFWQSFVTTNTVTTLPSETISVTYTNPTADPLAVTVVVNWIKSSKTYNVSLVTELTK